MRALSVAALAIALLSGCSDSNVVLQRQPATSVQAVGPLVASPKGRIVLSISGFKGVPRIATITFTQTGVSAFPALSFKGNTCVTSPPAPSNALNIENSSQSLANGTFTQSYDVLAQTHRYCAFTLTAAGNKTATIPFTVNL